MFAQLKPVHMSGDETDGEQKRHPPVFRVVNADWMSQELRSLFERLDQLYREDWERPGGGIRATRGNPPRTRLPSNGKSVNSIAPTRLAKNCYDSRWLGSLREHELVKLQVLNEVWDLSIPADIDQQMAEVEEEL